MTPEITLETKLRSLYDRASGYPAEIKTKTSAKLNEYGTRGVNEGVGLLTDLIDEVRRKIENVNEWALDGQFEELDEMRETLRELTQTYSALTDWISAAQTGHDLSKRRKQITSLSSDYDSLNNIKDELWGIEDEQSNIASVPEQGVEKIIHYLDRWHILVERIKDLEKTKLKNSKLELTLNFEDQLDTARSKIRQYFGDLSRKITNLYKAKKPDPKKYHKLKTELNLFTDNSFLESYIDKFQEKLDKKLHQIIDIEKAFKSQGIETTSYDNPIYVITDPSKEYYFVIARKNQEKIMRPLLEEVVEENVYNLSMKRGAKPLEDEWVLFRLECETLMLKTETYDKVIAKLKEPGIKIREHSEFDVRRNYSYPDEYDFILTIQYLENRHLMD